MTSWPAARMGLTNRGVLREGHAADVVIFDYDKIKDTATWEEPTTKPLGISTVIVNGKVTLKNGKHTGVKAGQVLYGPGYNNSRE